MARNSQLSGMETQVREAILTDGRIKLEPGGALIFERENQAVALRPELITTLTSLGYEQCGKEAREALFATLSTGMLVDKGHNPTAYTLDRFGTTPFDGSHYPALIPGRRRALVKTQYRERAVLPDFMKDLTYGVVVDLTDLAATPAMDEIAEKYGTSIVELSDGEGRTEVHMQTSFGHNFAHITHDDGSVALISYRQNQTDNEIMFDQNIMSPELNYDDILSGGEGETPLVVDWDSIKLPASGEAEEYNDHYWRTIARRSTVSLDLVRFAAALPPGTVIETESDEAMRAVTAARSLVSSDGKVKPRMSYMPPINERIVRAAHGARLPTKAELGVEGHWGTFGKYRIMLLDPDVRAVEADMAKTVRWHAYDPDSVLSTFIGLPLKHSGKGVVAIASSHETTYTRYRETDWGDSKKSRRAFERRTALTKTKRMKNGAEILKEIRRDSAAIAISLEQAGVRYPILAGLPTLGKRR